MLGYASTSGKGRSCHHGPIPALAADADDMNNDHKRTCVACTGTQHTDAALLDLP